MGYSPFLYVIFIRSTENDQPTILASVKVTTTAALTSVDGNRESHWEGLLHLLDLGVAWTDFVGLSMGK